MDNNIWIFEDHTAGYGVRWRIKNVLYSQQTEYQHLAIVDTVQWGKAMFLDGNLQVTESDEFIYHEMIVHAAMNTHPRPQNILIIGGGDGGTLREVLKYEAVERVDMVEIDRLVVEASKQYFPRLASAFGDARSNLYIEDGIKFVQETGQKYDIIMVDSSDPIGPAVQLYSEDFYRNCHNILREDGMLVVQSESPLFYRDLFVQIYGNLKQVYPQVYVYWATVPTYVSGPWTFTIGSKKYDPLRDFDSSDIPPDLHYYNQDIHRAAFSLPQFIREIISSK